MLQANIAMNDSYDTRLRYTHTVQCHTDHSLQCWSEVFFFNFTKMFVIIIIYAYFIDISQGSVETHLQCGGICNNHISQIVCRVCQ